MSMLNLQKGARMDLTKGKNLKHVKIGLGWDVPVYSNSKTFDLDASLFLLQESGKAKDISDVVYFNNLTHYSGAVVHHGDNLTGDGEGDDEVIDVFFEMIPQGVTRIAVTATIHEADTKEQNFGMVKNAYLRIDNGETGEKIAQFDLGEKFSTETAVVVGELYLYNGEWKFEAVGSGFSEGMRGIERMYT